MKNVIFTLVPAVLVLYIFSCSGNDIEPLNGDRVAIRPVHSDPRCMKVDKYGECVSYAMSVFELLANNVKYHDKVITLGGYINLSFEGNALYPTKEHYQYGLVKDAIWLDITDSDSDLFFNFRAGYGYVAGTYDRYDGGHYRIFSGSLHKINWFRKIKKRE